MKFSSNNWTGSRSHEHCFSQIIHAKTSLSWEQEHFTHTGMGEVAWISKECLQKEDLI